MVEQLVYLMAVIVQHQVLVAVVQVRGLAAAAAVIQVAPVVGRQEMMQPAAVAADLITQMDNLYQDHQHLKHHQDQMKQVILVMAMPV